MRRITKLDLRMHQGSGDVFTDVYPRHPHRAARLRRRARHRRTFFEISARLASVRSSADPATLASDPKVN